MFASVEFLPRGIEKFFPQVQGISISNSKLKSITKHDLEAFKDLKEFFLQQTELEALEKDVFEFNGELRGVSIKNNSKLRLVGEDILDSLSKLEVVNFQFNQCIDEIAADQIKIAELQNHLIEKCSPANLFASTVTTTTAATDIKVKSEVEIRVLEARKDGDHPIRKSKNERITNRDNTNEIEKLKLETEALKSQLQATQAELDRATTSYIELRKKFMSVKSEIAPTKFKLNAMQLKAESCDGNLESALKNLFIANKKVSSCENPKTEFIVHSFEQQTINLTCKNDCDGVCMATGFQVKSCNTTIEFLLIEDGNIIDSSNKTKFTIVDQQTLFLPTNIAQQFPNLNELFVSGSGLYVIDELVFKNMHNLIALTLRENKLQELPSKAFAGLKILRDLDLSLNRIAVIEDGAFSGLEMLQKLKLNNNLVVSVSDITFRDLPNLRELYIEKNKLKFISVNLSRSMTQLAFADFTSNECVDSNYPTKTLDMIQQKFDEKCVAHVELSCQFTEDKISFNQTVTVHGFLCKAQNLLVEQAKSKIAKVTGKTVSHTQVISFVAIDQSMKYFQLDLAKYFPQLAVIVIKGSKLTALQRHDFRDLTQLRWISINHNNLLSIDGETFEDVQQVEHIDLSQNNIQVLPPRVFVNLAALKTLILSNNQIKQLAADVLQRNIHIESFRIDNNYLELIDSVIIKYLVKAKTIDFSLNKCIDLKFDNSMKVKKLEELFNAVDAECSLDA